VDKGTHKDVEFDIWWAEYSLAVRRDRERAEHWSDAEWMLRQQQKHTTRLCSGVCSVVQQRSWHWSVCLSVCVRLRLFSWCN